MKLEAQGKVGAVGAVSPTVGLSPTVVIVGLLLASVLLLFHARCYNFISDDAYITFRYSWNLAHHGQLTFNLDERVEGYSNFLWTVLLGAALRLGVAPELSSQVLGGLCGVAVLLLMYALTRVYRGRGHQGQVVREPWDMLAPWWLALSTHMAVWCSGGLETQLFTALMLAGMVLYVQEVQAERPAAVWRPAAAGFVLALAALTRPEGMLVFGLSAVHRAGLLLFHEKRWRPRWPEVAWFSAFLVPFGAFFCWRYWYYGYPLPNTFYVKASGDGLAMLKQWGWPYLVDFFRESKLYLLLPLLVGWLAWSRFRAPHTRVVTQSTTTMIAAPGLVFSYLALVGLPYLAYVAHVGGDFMSLGRFLVPLLPLFAFVGQELLRALAEGRRTATGPGRWSRYVPVATIVLLATAYNSRGLYRESQALSYRRWGLDTPAYLHKFAAERIRIGTWMREHFPADTYIAVGGAGASVYASRFRALDAYGLNDAWIAHHAPRSGTRPGHAAFAPLEYVLQRKPDLLCHIGKQQDLPYQPPIAEQADWRRHGYHWICLDPGGISPRYYCCLKRVDRVLGPFPAEVGS